MTKAIVEMIEWLLSYFAVSIIVGCGIFGFTFPEWHGIPSQFAGNVMGIQIFVGVLGLCVGLTVVTIILGVPLLLVQIKRNLESINSTLAEQSRLHLSNSRAGDSK